jgi:hypothetical protein
MKEVKRLLEKIDECGKNVSLAEALWRVYVKVAVYAKHKGV